MMITFEDARAAFASAMPDYRVAPYGYETDTDWILILLPETNGGHMPLVSKETGDIRFIGTYSPEFTTDRPVGQFEGQR